MQSEISGIILAGGKSSRMGQDKGLLPFLNRPMVEYALETLSGLTNDIVLVANSDEYAKFSARWVMDEVQNVGPLGGLMTGLRIVKQPFAFVLPCDSPKVPFKLLSWMWAQNTGKASVLKANGRLYPLIGIYGKADLAIIESMIAHQELRLQDLVAKRDAQILEPENAFPDFSLDWLANYNSMADFEQETQ